VTRKVENQPSELVNLLELANRLFTQKRDGRQKLYSVHEPKVECIGKGKAHKKFEFGTKVGLVTTAKTNWIVGAEAIARQTRRRIECDLCGGRF